MKREPTHRRGDLRGALERDLARQRRRADSRSFWRSLALIGSVGWPIALLGAGGALLGHALDARWGTGVRFTLLLVVLGTVAGSAIAWRFVKGEP